MNWTAESISLVSHLILIVSFWQKKATRIFLLQIISLIVFIVYLLVLDPGQIVFLVSCAVALTRNIALYFYRKADKVPPVPLLLLFLCIISAVFFIYLDDWIDVIPALLTLMYTYSCFYGSPFQIKIVGGVIQGIGHVLLFSLMFAPVALVFNAAILIGTVGGLIYDELVTKKKAIKEEVACMIEESRKEQIEASP